MTRSIIDILQSIPDSQTVQVTLLTKDGRQLFLDCVFKVDTPPHFTLVIPSEEPLEALNIDVKLPLVISHRDSTDSLSATIVEQVDERTLTAVARTALDPASLREYFRVNTSTTIVASHDSGSKGDETSNWKINGLTQDLSGSGVLALFPGEPQHTTDIYLEIFLPERKTTIGILAHVIRIKRLRSKRWQVAFHFDNISNKQRDAIITYLLGEQRKQLRQKVNV